MRTENQNLKRQHTQLHDTLENTTFLKLVVSAEQLQHEILRNPVVLALCKLGGSRR